MLHRLTEWEDNGYDDSDFWVSVYDDETNEVRAVLAGSTRFAGNAPGEGPDLGQPISDPAVLQNAIRLLGEHIFRLLRETEDKDVLEPVAVERGVCVRLLRDCRHKHFVLPAGTVGRVFWSGAFGQFFRNGYNRPGRQNTRVGISLNDSTTAYVALSACRLDREPEGNEPLHTRAWELAQHCEFSRMTGRKHAWDSENFAMSLFKKVNGAALQGSDNLVAA
jgi:hypothetical protein